MVVSHGFLSSSSPFLPEKQLKFDESIELDIYVCLYMYIYVYFLRIRAMNPKIFINIQL